MNQTIQTIILTVVISFIIGAVSMSMLIWGIKTWVDGETPPPGAYGSPTVEDLRIAKYYASETAALVSPHHIRKEIMEGKDDFVLVDVRSPEEYEAGHIVGAVSVPAYLDKENTQKTDQERIIDSFRTIQTQNPGKDVIIYCYSHACMTGRKMGHMLAQNGIYVRELGVGWNEWRHFWKEWNYPHEWEHIDPLDYVAVGTEPGTFRHDNDAPLPQPCNVDNEFGC